ncbi:MAG TPA: PmoA family protein [Polyangia bacterium]|nr:PmoA family protein [Polyangia bacterium]
MKASCAINWIPSALLWAAAVSLSGSGCGSGNGAAADATTGQPNPGPDSAAGTGGTTTVPAGTDSGASGGGGPATGGAGGGQNGDSGSGGAMQPASGNLTVSAGTLARDHTIVTFSLPGSAGKTLALRDAQGATLPLQVDMDGVATFVLPSLAAGQDAHYAIVDPASPPSPIITTTPEANGVRIKNGDSDLLRFQTVGQLPAGAGQQYLRGGYIYPFYTPSGGIPTDDYPPSHPHQHGIWDAWLSATFAGHTINFWDFTGGARGKVDFQALDGMWQGPVHGGVRARLAHIDLSGGQGVTALNEQWMITAYHTHDGAAPYFVFDLTSTQEAATAQPFVVNQTTYSGFGVRGARPWVGGGGVTYLSSEGLARGPGDNTPSRWTYLGGMVNGKVVGSVMMGHPQNFRAPQKVRFNPTEPYWAFAPMRDGSFTIATGQPLNSRFRVLTFDGPPDRALIDRLWSDFATPPAVHVE